jgi:hypothetical protein
VQRVRPATPEQQWLDPAYVVPAALAQIESTYWGGEAIPSYLLMGGWAVCNGATPHFNWNTIWHDPMPIDWENPPTFAMNWDDPWLQRYHTLYTALVEAAGWDDFLVGHPCILPGNDILVAIMSNEEFLMGLHDRPEWMRAAILQLAHNQQAAIKHCTDSAAGKHAFSCGNPQWMTFWAPEPYISTQSDVSCMLSTEMYDEFILPEIELLGQEFGNV